MLVSGIFFFFWSWFLVLVYFLTVTTLICTELTSPSTIRFGGKGSFGDRRPKGSLAARYRRSLMGFSYACQEQLLVISARLALDPIRQARPVPGLVRTANIGHVGPVPVKPDYAIDQKVIFGTCAGHGVLEELRLVHVFILAVSQLEQQRVFHVSRELL